MNGFGEGRQDMDRTFSGKEYRVSRERIDTGDEAYEKISIFDEEGLVAGLEYIADNFDEDFQMLSQRDDSEVEIYERGSGEEMELEEFREMYNHLNSDGTEMDLGLELEGSETAETYQR
ncbi:hypothetical protein GKQ38_02860 [Candidatus Nanohaloarchaea archaeon]|nr:hypothetical protein GKQ38_02860 [Candidatus Nanohaloarchaea archaeon]